jgi:hypothetical protein
MDFKMERFTVKKYETGRPIIKGNGFDGLEVGEFRYEAEQFIAFVNKLIGYYKGHHSEPKPEPQVCTYNPLKGSC